MTRRAQEEVDLTYITPRTIAMSFPATGMEVAYRNDIDDVAALLRRNHGAQFYAVWNLTERGYDYAKLDSNVRETGWPDHHAPPLLLLLQILLSLEDWLEANDRNVVVLHCLAGKGRTGLVIACQLFYTAQCSSMRSALRLFAERRSKTAKGVRQLSQLRYSYYLERALTSPVQLRQRRLRLVALTMRGAPAFEQYYTPSSATYVLGCSPLVEVYRYFPPSPDSANGHGADAHHPVHPNPGDRREGAAASSNNSNAKLGYAFRIVYTDCQLGFRPKRQFTVFSESLTLPLDTVVEGDVLIKVLHHKERAVFNNRIEMFHCQFNTMFVDEVDSNTGRLILSLPKAELNEAQGNSKFTNSFCCTLEFEDLDAPVTYSIGAAAPDAQPAVPAASATAAAPVAAAFSSAASVPSSPALNSSTATAFSSSESMVSAGAVVDHPLQPSDADHDSPVLIAARARSRQAAGSVRSQQHSEMSFEQTLSLMRKRFRERQRERAAAQAAATGDGDPEDSKSSEDSNASTTSSAVRRRHGDPSGGPPPLAATSATVSPMITVTNAEPLAVAPNGARRASEDGVLGAVRSKSAGIDSNSPRVFGSNSFLVPTSGSGVGTSTVALDLARPALTMSTDNAFVDVDANARVSSNGEVLKRSSDEPAEMRRSRSRTHRSLSPPPPQPCELCQEATAVAKLVLTNGSFVLACQSCSESRLASASESSSDDDDASDNAGHDVVAGTVPSDNNPVEQQAITPATRAMSFIDLGDEHRVKLTTSASDPIKN